MLHSFNNFLRDHKCTKVKVGLDENEFTKEFKIKKTFDNESHVKSKEDDESGKSDDSNDIASS